MLEHNRQKTKPLALEGQNKGKKMGTKNTFKNKVFEHKNANPMRRPQQKS